ncbi:SRPBCC domain-containing protein [Paenibacillus sp. GCM10023252]|uniref:SRPBCC family protein n=1 Tax=Paenibacillus sp. GCM10023252 TaxID=3252649 RepID=UPI00361EC52F
MSKLSKVLEITRVIDAPRELVYEAFTAPEHLLQWWGPEGWEMRVSTFEFRPSGVFHYSQQSPDGHLMWVKFVYHELNAPEKIVYTSAFCDGDGQVVRAPFDPNWPLATRTTFTFTEQAGQTLLTMTAEPVEPTEQEAATFAASGKMMEEGFGGTFQRLASYLSERSVG